MPKQKHDIYCLACCELKRQKIPPPPQKKKPSESYNSYISWSGLSWPVIMSDDTQDFITHSKVSWTLHNYSLLSIITDSYLQLWVLTMRGKSSWNTCLKCALLVTISFLFHTTLFKDHKSPTPKSMLFLVEEILESVNLPDGTLEAATPQSCLLIKKCSDPSDLRITPRREPSSSLSKSQPYPFWVVVAFCSTVAPDSIHVPVTRSVMVHGNLSWSGGVVETPVAVKYYILLIFF